MTSQDAIALVIGILVVGVPVVLVSWLVLKGKRSFEEAATRSLKSLYADVERRARVSSAPVVKLRYHTYSGLLLWTLQTEHALELPRDVAEYALAKFLRHSLTWGFFAYGMVIIPLPALANFAGQRASIARQARRAAAAGRPRSRA